MLSKVPKITVAMLPNLLGSRLRVVLLCRVCGGEQSAHICDYWYVAADHVFRHCDKPMRLVCKSTIYRTITPRAARRRAPIEPVSKPKVLKGTTR